MTRLTPIRAAFAAALVLACASPAAAGSFLVFQDNASGFDAALAGGATATIVDTGGAFAPDPAAGVMSSVARSGTIAGQAYSFRVHDVNFSNAPSGTIAPGAAGGDIANTSTLTVESPVSQGTATGSGSFGYDSAGASDSTASRNALLVDFTTTPGNLGIGHFALDLIDFEASAAGTPGLLRLYSGGALVFSHAFSFAGPNAGNNEVHFLGVVAADDASFFDQVVVVVGDDTPGGSGNSESWAADRFRFGVTNNPEPGTIALFSVGVAGLAVVVRRRRSQTTARRSAETPASCGHPRVGGAPRAERVFWAAMTPQSNAADDLARLRRLVASAAEWLDGATTDTASGGTDRLARVNPEVSQWSPRQQLDHAALATISICRAVEKILAEAPGCGGPGPAGPHLQMILTTGFIPRGVADAPEKMKPAPDVSHAATRAHLDDADAALAALAPRIEGAGAGVRFPHFVLGPMTVAEWLRFGCIHFDHHVALARDAADD